jgi:hypothetical protein
LNRPKSAARILLTLCARDWRKLEAAETPSSEYGAPSQSLQPTASRRELPILVQKRRQLFIRTHNEPLAIATAYVSNPDCPSA